LLANSGIDYHQFINYTETIANRVISQAEDALHCLRHHKQTKQKAEMLPSLNNLFKALTMSDFSANRKLNTSSIECERYTTSSEDSTLQLALLRAFEAKQLGIVLHKIKQDCVPLDTVEQSKMENLVKMVDDVMTHCCQYTNLPGHWFTLK
jgi:hypothetical protein